LGFGLSSASLARPANAAANPATVNAQAPQVVGEEVDSIPMLRPLHSWTAVDDDTVIVWTTPWDAYLVKLSFPSHDLPFAQAIGVTSVGSRVYAKFDAVQVRGFRYPIEGIFKLTRDEAKALTRRPS
jgi:hypothetical protein